MIFEILEIAERELRKTSLDDLRRVHGGIDRLPRGDQDQHAPGAGEDRLAAARAGRDIVSHELPARASDRAALFDARYPQELPPHLLKLTAFAGSRSRGSSQSNRREEAGNRGEP